MTAMRELQADSLYKHFRTVGGETLKAVDGVSLAIEQGTTLGIIGESGSGKSTLGRMLVGLTQPTAGTVRYRGSDIFAARHPRGRPMQMIFQDPHAALNPRMRVLDSVAEPLRIAGRYRAAERRNRAAALLERVDIPIDLARRYPHELSGGQKQRVNIARALSIEPSLLVCDEATAALDVSIQAGILNLLLELQREGGLTYVFITHNLMVARHMSHRIAVMYLGCFVEHGLATRVAERPAHPYTRALLSAEPDPLPASQRRSERILLQGEVPSPTAPPSGCRFRTRCPKATPYCAEAVPEWRAVGPDHWAACHFAEATPC
jgi:oligopeptide/dipeptide ABC transporter ATP-binding protein